MKDLYIIGCGGFGREVMWLVERINAEQPQWNIKGFIDDNSNLKGEEIYHQYSVVGNTDDLLTIKTDFYVVCAVGSATTRKEVIDKIKENGFAHFATLLDPSVIISDNVSIGEGSIVCAGTIITVDIKIGKYVIINLDCTLGHDAILNDFVTIYPSVNISGNVEIGRCTEIGTGSHIIQGKNIGENSIIGAGSVVIRDIPSKCTAVGSPAKPIKFFE